MSGPAELRQASAAALAEVQATRAALSRQLAEISAERDALSKQLIECVAEREEALRHRTYAWIVLNYLIRGTRLLYRSVPTPRLVRPLLRQLQRLVGTRTKPRRPSAVAESAVSDHGVTARQLEEALATIALRGRTRP